MSEHNPGMEYDEPEETQGEALAEEDLSDEALGGPDNEGWRADLERAPLNPTTAAGDTYDESTGEVLKDAPGWDPETKRILNNDGCNFFGVLLRETREAMAENERLAAPEIQALERKLEIARQRLARAQKPLESRSAWLEGVIRAYAEEHKADVLRGLRKGAKSRAFPSGLRLAWKSGGGEYRWRQDMSKADRDAALLKWGKDRERMRSDWRDYSPLVLMREYVSRESALLYVAEAKKLEGVDVGTPPGLEYVPEHEELKIAVENDK